jgi:hypothetical protein
VRVSDGSVGDETVHHVNAAEERRLFLTRFGEAEIGE